MTTHFFLKSVFNQYCGNLSLIDFFVRDGFYYFTFQDLSRVFNRDFYFGLLSFDWFKNCWHYDSLEDPHRFSLAISSSLFDSLDGYQFARYLKNNSAPF